MKNYEMRNLLYAIDKRCRKCHRRTRLPDSGPKRDNTATIQHIYFNGHPLRIIEIAEMDKVDETIITLFCNKCNERDNSEIQSKLPNKNVRYDTFECYLRQRIYYIYRKGVNIGFVYENDGFKPVTQLMYGAKLQNRLEIAIDICKAQLLKLKNFGNE